MLTVCALSPHGGGAGRGGRIVPFVQTALKKKQPQCDTRDDLMPASSADEPCAQTSQREADAAGIRADASLAQRCLAGEVAAWEQLYGQCHEPLLVSIRVMLGRQSSDASLVDEIAARVWYALVANDGELLLQYDPARGARLVTFLRALAKDELARYFREEVRRRQRELSALRERPQHLGKNLGQPANTLAEFLGTLTPHERGFCNDYLLTEPSVAAEGTHSTATIWQLSHRIYRKLLHFLDFRP